MLTSLSTRHRQEEWMDAPDVDPDMLRRSLRFIRLVNTWLGYTRATIFHLKRFSRNWRPGERISLIDLATGSGDVPRAILKWGEARGFDLHIVGIDRHATTARAAAEPHDPRFQIVQADALRLPFEAGSFDYALCSMFLHHLDDEDAVRVLATMGRISRRGIIAADLLRHRRAFAWISLFTALANPMVRHDARVSVAQAFVKREVLQMRVQAGIEFAQYFRHFGHRFVLAGEK